MSVNKGILVITQVRDNKLSPATVELFGAAQLITAASGEGINAVIIGDGAKATAAEAGKLGVDKVFIVESADLTADAASIIIIQAVGDAKPRVILMVEDDLGKDLAPILAASLQTAAVTDAVALRIDDGRIVITRPVYGGSALADFSIETEPQIISLRSKAFTPASSGNGTADIVELDIPDSSVGVRVIERVTVKEEGPRIEDAKIVIGGGRGIGGPEGFAQLKELASLMGGSVGASRPPCDQDWWPESGQIGLTGKIIAPDLYIAVGISGSSQHLSGVSGAKTVVAINKDAEANIFTAATYGITGDWKKVVPAFIAKTKELTGK